jgi:hypothetical protein
MNIDELDLSMRLAVQVSALAAQVLAVALAGTMTRVLGTYYPDPSCWIR